MGEYSDNYYSWMDKMSAAQKSVIDEGIKDALAYSLSSGDISVFDSMPKIRDDIFGKRKRGRPKKEEDNVFKREGFAEGILREEKKERERKLDRLNPQPTEKLKHLQELKVKLREIGFEVEGSLKSRDEIEAMLSDIDSLRKEAGLKKIDQNFVPYGNFRNAAIDYIGKKNDFNAYMESAKECIEKNEERRADELIAAIKDEPKTLKESYQKIIDSYSDLCNALTAIIERKAGNEDFYANISEVVKAGNGLIDGEDFKAYSKRMKSLSKSREIPKTIKDTEDKIERTEKQWRSVAGISIDEFEKVKENWKRSISLLMRKSSIASNMKIYEVNTLIGGGDKNSSKRVITDGVISDHSEYFKDDIKYGCLHSITPTRRDNEIGDSFGEIVVRWKPHCVVATMTFGDSLDIESSETTFETPCLVSDASPCCFNPLKQDAVNKLKDGILDIGLESVRSIFGIPYIELQLHGEGWYKPESVASISFDCEDDIRNLSQSSIEQIIKNNIPVYIKDEKVKIADYIWSEEV